MSITPLNMINLRDGQFDSTSRQELDALFAAFAADGTNRLAIHFHGGLTSEKEGTEIADRLLPLYRQTNVAYPAFFVWESGLLDTLRTNGLEIFGELFFRRLLQRVLQFAAGKVMQGVGERGISVTPESMTKVDAEIERVAQGDEGWPEMTEDRRAAVSELSPAEAQQFRDLLESDPAFMNEVQQISNSVEPQDELARSRGLKTAGSKKTLMSPEVLQDIQREQAAGGKGARGLFDSTRLIRGAIVIIARVISRFRNKRDHGFHATVVEEIFREFYVSAVGREVWGAMKKDTADAFDDNPNVFGGTALLAKLAESAATAPRVMLIGHSAGSEYVCNLLRTADRFLPDTFQFDVVLMAPACRIELFADTLAHHGSRIRDFRCFTMRDELEKKDRLIPVVYPHSLLYFVSGVFEDEADKPILGMERYFVSDARHYQEADTGIPAVKDFLRGGSNRLLLSVSDAGAGLSTNSITHGGFDNSDDASARATIESVSHMLKNGF
jgi:hypothetical protein